jgi:hypothetical protein
VFTECFAGRSGEKELPETLIPSQIQKQTKILKKEVPEIIHKAQMHACEAGKL